MTCSRPVQSTGPVNQQIDHLGACINDHNLDLVVSACSDASEDGEDELKEEGVGHVVVPVAINQGNVDMFK